MVSSRHVPWQGWKEWEAVRAGLFCDSRERSSEALDQVKAWRARGRLLPLGVDITATLLEISTLKDSGYATHQPASPDLEMQLRLQYSMTIIRLVNGISDSSQKGRVAASVLSNAEEAGLPRMLVAVRHEAAHNELPSLSHLRLGVDRALAWLKENYWERQAQYLQTNQALVSSLLKEYVAIRQALLAKSFPASAAVAADAAVEEDGEDGEEAAATHADHEQSAGLEAPTDPLKRQSRILKDLKELVHSSATQFVADPIIDDVLEPPALRDDGSKPAEAVVNHVLASLEKLMPDIRSALLVGAVDRIVSSATQGSNLEQLGSYIGREEQPTEGRFQDLLAWVKYLLPHGSETHQGKGKTKKGTPSAAAGRGWQPSVAQAKVLLAQCFRAPATGTRSARQQAAVDQLVGILTGFLRRQAVLPQQLQKSASTTSRPEQLSKVTQQQKPSPAVDTSPAAPAALQPEQSPQAEALPRLEQLQQAAQEERRAQLADLERAVQAKRAKLGSEQARQKKWQLVQDWRPCALGNLPSVHSSNGRLSVLEGQLLRTMEERNSGMHPNSVDRSS